MHHLVYKIVNKLNGRYYIGVHSTDDIDDSYMGSGELIRKAIEKHGVSNFEKIILRQCSTLEEAYHQENLLVKTTFDDPLSYNMNAGGKGGWDHVNRDPNRTNSMHDPLVVKKVSVAMKKRYANVTERAKLLEYQKRATEAAARSNTGKSRPDHAEKMKQLHAEGRLFVGVKRSPSTFLVTDTEGRNYTVYNLKEFCHNNDLPYVSLWNSSNSGKPLKRGKAKGWSCKIIQKGHYESNKRST